MNKIHIVSGCIYMCTLAFLSIIHVSDAHAESISKEDFIAESTKAWDELLSIYKGKGVSLSFRWQQRYGDDQYVHSRICVLENRQLIESELPDEHTKVIRVANDRYSFEIGEEQNAHWSIRNIVNGPDGMIDTINNNLNLLSLTPYLYPALIVQDCWLKDIVTTDSFVIESINESKENPNLITLEFSIDYNVSETQTLTHGSLVLDKNQYWIVQHSEVTLIETIDEPVEYLITAEKKYKTIDGVPFPVTVTTTLTPQNTAANPVPMQTTEHYDDPIFGDISKNVFYLNHYGISEPDFDGERPIGWFRYTLMAAGGLLIVFALWRMYRERKGTNV